jgi:RNA ligase (TIGR02306 family)
MSTHVVDIRPIDAIQPHPGADLLEIAVISGWQCVVPKGKHTPGEPIVYIPTDSVIPFDLSEALGITRYLSNGRVRCARLRGEPSFGVVADLAILPAGEWQVGDDVAETLGITKYLPPFRPSDGDAETPCALLQKYTNIENLRSFPEVFEPGEFVYVSEKLHGGNCKCALIDGEEMAGSMEIRRKRPADDIMARNLYWMPFTLPGVRELLVDLTAHFGAKQVILYGEVFGSQVQTLHYGHVGKLGYRAFDILVDGRYLDYAEFAAWCDSHGVDRVPELYLGPYDLATIAALAEGKTMLGEGNIREGVVVKPMQERIHPKVGRLAMKYVSTEYLLRKAGGKISDTTDQ